MQTVPVDLGRRVGHRQWEMALVEPFSPTQAKDTVPVSLCEPYEILREPGSSPSRTSSKTRSRASQRFAEYGARVNSCNVIMIMYFASASGPRGV